MSAIRDVESFADLLQYYTHGYVLSRRDPTTMYYVAGPGDGVKKTAVIVIYKNGKTLTENAYMTEPQVNDVFSWGLPTIGMTVFNDRELAYLYYKTSRNGTRGFNVERVVFHSFNGYVLLQNNLSAITRDSLVESTYVWQALTQEHTPLGVVWEDLTSKKPNKLAYSLSLRFGVHLTEQEYPVLCYKMYTIGEVLGPAKVRINGPYKEMAESIRRSVNPQMEVEFK